MKLRFDCSHAHTQSPREVTFQHIVHTWRCDYSVLWWSNGCIVYRGVCVPLRLHESCWTVMGESYAMLEMDVLVLLEKDIRREENVAD